MRKRTARRHRRRKITLYSRGSLVLLLTVVYMAVFVAPIFIQQFKEVNNVGGDVLLWQAILDGITTFIQIFCLLFGLTVLRVVWVILWPLLCVLTALSDYMIQTFHSNVSSDSVAVILESTSREISSFLNISLLLTLLSGLFLGIFGNILLKREKKDVRNRKAASMALVMALCIIVINEGSMSTRYAPYNFLTAAYQYGYQRYAAASDRLDISETPATFKATGTKPLVIVVVLGESARGDHFSINGYGRETTPLLQQRKNLVDFKDTISCGVWTRISVPCILTRATEADKSAIFTETSFISVFKKLGFKTAWFGAQGKFSMADPVTELSAEADEHVLLEEKQILDNTIKDEQLLPLLDKQLEQQTQPLLIILHTYGSHWQYSARYTKPFERYTPVCETTLSRKYSELDQVGEIKSCPADALVNSYDNSILYTDFILDQVMKRLENKNALFVYTSDHGESLGEHGRYLHGHDEAIENHTVPMFWWASDEFVAANANHWQQLVKKSAAPSSHDVIFHSVLDCAGVTSTLIDPALSLCNDGTTAPAEPGLGYPLPDASSPYNPYDSNAKDDALEEEDSPDEADAPVKQPDSNKNSSLRDEKILLDETK